MSEENYNENGCFTHEYPYTSHRELNLDWLIKLVQSKKVKDIEVTTNADHTYTVVITYADSTTATLNLASDVNIQEIYAIIEQQAILRRLFVVNYGSSNFTELNDAFTEGRVMACKKGTDLFFYDSKKAVYHDSAYYTRYTFKGLSAEKKTMYITVEQHTQTLAVSWAFTETALQEELVSGTNIKTVNGESILGSGNLAVTSIYMAEYNVATYADVKAAWDAGKMIVMYRLVGGVFEYAILTAFSSSAVADEFTFSVVNPSASDTYLASVYKLTYSKLTFTTTWSYDSDYIAKQDDLDEKQDTLVSGTNIKTINGNIVLGSGDLEIQTSPLTVASSLPTADETEYNKHLLYDSADEIKYIKQNPPSIVESVISGASVNKWVSGTMTPFVKNNIVYFVNNNGLQEYNINNKSIQTYSLPTSLCSSRNIVCEYNNKIYIAGHDDYTEKILIVYEYDTATHTATEKVRHNVQRINSNITSNGRYLYRISGKNSTIIYKIDLETFEITQLTGNLTYYTCDASSIIIGDKLYIFGGYYWWSTTTLEERKYIQIYNISSETMIQSITYTDTKRRCSNFVPSSNGFIFANSTKLYLYDVSNDTINEIGNLPHFTSKGMITPIYNNNIIYFKGEESSSYSLYNIAITSTYDYLTLPTTSSILPPLTVVSTLPTADATEYAKHLMYLDTTDNKLKYIVESSGTYSYNTLAIES